MCTSRGRRYFEKKQTRQAGSLKRHPKRLSPAKNRIMGEPNFHKQGSRPVKHAGNAGGFVRVGADRDISSAKLIVAFQDKGSRVCDHQIAGKLCGVDLQTLIRFDE